jgi:phage terminase large subunit GpA-like protein
MKIHDLCNDAGIKLAYKKSLLFLKPAEKLKPSEFAELHVRIAAGNAIPGPIRFRNTPHVVEPLNLIDDPTCHRITLMFAAQTAKTTLQQCAMAYFIGHKPRNMMAMQPSQSDMSTWDNAKFAPMIEASPLLSDRVAKPRAREGVNNQNMKTYPGGILMFAWAGSPKTMRGRSAGIIFPDETDGYEVTAEGHPVALLEQRSATFGDERLLFETSTPTTKKASYIEPAFEQGDQRRFHVPCGDCGEKQIFKWSQVTWLKDEDGQNLPETAKYTCEHCGTLWGDGERFKAIDNGQWIATKPFRGHASFHFPEMGSKFRKLRDIVQSFIDKKAAGALQTFVNVSLAETWEEEGDKQSPDELYARREHYKEEVPNGAFLVTAAVDTQNDRLEIQYEAWGANQENWKVAFEVIRGDLNKPEIWKRLDASLDRKFKHENGLTLDISGTAIDTGGSYTQQVYDYVRRRGYGIFAIKGSSNKDAPLVNRPTKSNLGKINLFSLGVHKLKTAVMQRAKILEPGAGYTHFPVSEEFDQEWFAQFTSEQLITKYIKGVRKQVWDKMRPRNEAFDLSVYNSACLIILNPNFEQLQREFEKRQYSEKNKDKPKPKNKPKGSWVNTTGDSWL